MRLFTEQAPGIAAANATLTVRAVAWAVVQMRRENASVRGIARQLRVAWRTVWTHVEAELRRREQDPSRFDGVEVLGVDEHLWHHVSTKPVADGGRGPKELTGMVDLTRDSSGRVRARLLDLVPGRSSGAYADWIKERDDAFRAGAKIAALDPFAGYKKALDDELDDAVAVLDAFHVVKLGTAAVDEVRRRVQQDTLDHRGRKGDPLTGSGTSSAPAGNDSPTGRRPAWKPRSRSGRSTSRSKSPDTPPSSSATPTNIPTWPRERRSRCRCSRRSLRARSRRSPGSGRR